MSSRYLALILFAASLSCCADFRVSEPDRLTSVSIAEEYIYRHGYTSAGHPPDLPVERVELFDILGGDPLDLASSRKDTLEPRSFAIATDREGNQLALFLLTHGLRCFRAVLVQNGEATAILEATPTLAHMRIYSIPSNTPWSGPPPICDWGSPASQPGG
jgi:hypothetical protein